MYIGTIEPLNRPQVTTALSADLHHDERHVVVRQFVTLFAKSCPAQDDPTWLPIIVTRPTLPGKLR